MNVGWVPAPGWLAAAGVPGPARQPAAARGAGVLQPDRGDAQGRLLERLQPPRLAVGNHHGPCAPPRCPAAEGVPIPQAVWRERRSMVGGLIPCAATHSPIHLPLLSPACPRRRRACWSCGAPSARSTPPCPARKRRRRAGRQRHQGRHRHRRPAADSAGRQAARRWGGLPLPQPLPLPLPTRPLSPLCIPRTSLFGVPVM